MKDSFDYSFQPYLCGASCSYQSNSTPFIINIGIDVQVEIMNDFCVVSTLSLCTIELRQMIISLLFQVTRLGNLVNRLREAV